MNRLLEESYYENEAKEKIQYEYDLCGNRLRKRFLQGRKEDYEENLSVIEERSWYNNKNQLVKIQSEKETVFYTYDKQGNTIKEVGGQYDWTYTYNPFGQQIRSENTSGYFQENFYDGEYLRAGIKKNGSSSKFLYYQGELLSEITKKQEERKGNRLILGYGVVVGEELYLQSHRQVQGNLHSNGNRKSFGFYHLDEQNSTAFITGRNQEIQNAYQYDAFGNVRRKKETLHNRILYTGQQYDKESNQYYLRARYYNPTLGRFTQEDVYRGDGLNLYDYCKGNPVVWYDPSGYEKYKNKSDNYPDTKFENEKGKETVTYRRVQGGAGNQSSQQRIYIDDNGNIYINKKNRNLNISIDNGEHSQYYITHNRPGADVYEFEVPKWLDDMVQKYTIPQAGYKNNPLNQGGSAPKLTDPTTPGKSIEFPEPWVEWIEEYATNGRIIKGGN